MKRILMMAISMALVSGISMAYEPVELETENDRINYSVGYRLGGAGARIPANSTLIFEVELISVN